MKIINVVAAIIKKNNKVFITQRGHGEFKGKWEFPGGNLELTEHLASKWVDPSEINDKDFLEADKPILDNLKDVYITIEIDIETKEKFEKICEDAGLTMSSAILLFIEEVVREGRLPFDLTR